MQQRGRQRQAESSPGGGLGLDVTCKELRVDNGVIETSNDNTYPTSAVAHQWPLSAVPAAAAPPTCPAPVAPRQSLQWCHRCRRHRCPHRIIVHMPLLLQADKLCHVGGNVNEGVHRLSFRFNGFPALEHLSRAAHDHARNKAPTPAHWYASPCGHRGKTWQLRESALEFSAEAALQSRRQAK